MSYSQGPYYVSQSSPPYYSLPYQAQNGAPPYSYRSSQLSPLSSPMSYSGSQQSNSSSGSSYGHSPVYNTISPNQMHIRDPVDAYSSSTSSYNVGSSSENSTYMAPNTKSAKTYPCVWPGCPSAAKGSKFTRLADLERHTRTVHCPTYKDCPHKWCGRVGNNGFTRDDHLKEHLNQMHAGRDFPPARSRR